MSSAKVPRVPPAPLSVLATEVVDYTGPQWRIHRTAGAHVLAWNEPRLFGPLTSMRFDPHPDTAPGPAVHDSAGVHYSASDVATAVAEVFQRSRAVDMTSGRPMLTGWLPVRPLRLLDLGGSWALRHGAAQSLASAPRSVCRAWARAIATEIPELDGVRAPSTMTGAANVVLWQRAADALPSAPAFSRPLDHPDVRRMLGPICETIGYRLL